MPLIGLLAIWALLILLPASSAAQTPASSLRIIDVAHDPGGPMTVTFEATSSVASLEVLLGDTPVDFELTSTNSPAPRLILVIENSASITATHRTQIQTAALDLIDVIGDSTQVAIIAYGAGTQTALPFTTDRDAIATAITALPGAGGAALFSGVAAAADLATQAGGETLIVVVSYGWDWGSLSTTTRQASLAAIQASGAPVYVQSMVFFGEDIAYLTALSTTGTIHSLTELSALPNAATHLSKNTTAQHTIEIDRTQLLLGEHQLTLTLAGQSTTASIVDNSILSIGVTDSPADGSPLALLIKSNDELASTTLVATLDGNPIPIAAEGSITVDPWQFAPGDTSIEVRALLADQQIASVGSTITIPTLEPVISTTTTEGGSALIATLQAQPGTVTTLVALIDGNSVATSTTATLEVALPAEGIISIEARTADSIVLATASVTIEATAQLAPPISPAITPGNNPPIQLLAAGLAGLLTLVALAVFWRRKRTPSTPPLASATPASAAEQQPPPLSPHPPVELHPVGNCDIVIDRHGQQQERLPLGPGAISIGASPLCDITLNGRDMRFVHAVIGPNGPLLQIHRFGPITIDGRPVKDQVVNLAFDATLVIGNTTFTIVSQGEQPRQLRNGIVAA